MLPRSNQDNLVLLNSPLQSGSLGRNQACGLVGDWCQSVTWQLSTPACFFPCGQELNPTNPWILMYLALPSSHPPSLQTFLTLWDCEEGVHLTIICKLIAWQAWQDSQDYTVK